MTRYFGGIDPGVDGAIVLLDEQLTDVVVELMPTLADGPKGRRRVDVRGLARIVEERRIVHLVLEDIGARPAMRMGASSAISIGRNFGRVETVLAMLGIPHALVTPQAWQKAMCPGTGDPKARSVVACQRRLPMVQLIPPRCRVPHDGISDAALMALWAVTDSRQYTDAPVGAGRS